MVAFPLLRTLCCLLSLLLGLTTIGAPSCLAGAIAMREYDYQSLYRLFHAFTACKRKATHSLTGENEVAHAPEDHLCYTTDGLRLYLCEACLKFWQECRKVKDRSMWEMAVFLRESRAERQGES